MLIIMDPAYIVPILSTSLHLYKNNFKCTFLPRIVHQSEVLNTVCIFLKVFISDQKSNWVPSR